ncbi:MAG: GspE/PulE family protein [Lentisphaerae bacterium]|nr:GspE/PulE family protein [Lentisphaerota bacterium]MBT4816392.1 GspE/PulE family protein [Lentisphaerota bacterium]MBT5606839.1 GspE/PulE family protein [Lentisphaerota bacterium]MBT7055303.1 GspE/PulE family protein [Lentisphaerota bacterium]MBT7843084.1 GspE/PulE family protein [Lentisphaerota bacterium]
MTVPDSPDAFAPVATEFLQLVEGERITVYQHMFEEEELEPWYCSDISAVPQYVPVACDSVPGYVTQERRAVNIRDIHDMESVGATFPGLQCDYSYELETEEYTRSVMAVPIRSRDRVVGAIEVVNCRRAESHSTFTAEDMVALQELAGLMAPVFDTQESELLLPDPGAGSLFGGPFQELVERGLVTEEKLRFCETVAADGRVSVGYQLVTEASVPVDEIRACLEAYYGVPFMQFDPGLEVDHQLQDALNRTFLERRRWVPLSCANGRALVLIDDPSDGARLQEAESVLSVSDIDLRVALWEDIWLYIHPEKARKGSAVGAVNQSLRLDELLGELDGRGPGSGRSGHTTTELLDENAPGIVQVVSRLIADGIRNNASDIHIEPGLSGEPGGARIRVDGVCHKILDIPDAHMRAVLSRIKVMANMDITERRVPQDGKVTVTMGDRNYELRVATVPTVNGENAVMRVLSPGGVLSLGELNLLSFNQQHIEEMVTRPHGLFLVVGPTGSGKTTTLHAVLGHINTPERKIWTAEDPVEITQAGLQQLQVNPKVRVTFATALRAFLRADPDVILIGEMRDQETACAGIEASLTGHLVFSTLHTNSAPETVTRLLDMGLDPINFADALIGVLAQRLVRTLCSDCREPYTASQEELEMLINAYGEDSFPELGVDLSDVSLYKPVGCRRCLGTGYRGRTGIHELLVGSNPIKAMITHGEPAEKIRRLAVQEGMRTLRQDGIVKVLQGDTDARQVWGATVE